MHPIVSGEHEIFGLLARGTLHEDFEPVLGPRDHPLIAVLCFPKIDDFRQQIKLATPRVSSSSSRQPLA
jgi:hypothetical protein